MLTLALQSFNVQPVGGTIRANFARRSSQARNFVDEGKVLQTKQVKVAKPEVIAFPRPHEA